MKRVIFLLMVICWSCTHKSGTEKYLKKHDRTISVKERIKEINTGDILISQSNQMVIMGDYLIIGDYKSFDNIIHIFDKNNFNHVTSTGYKGGGPGEITNVGHIGVNETERIFYVSDHGKQRIFSYSLDSILDNPHYMPGEKIKMNERLFPSDYLYINDTLCIGLIIEPIGNTSFKQSVGKWNMNTGGIEIMKYEHPVIQKKRVALAVSAEKGLYAECYRYHDLMSICDLDGNLKHNIYGPNWSRSDRDRNGYYEDASFCGDYIIAGYLGEKAFIENGERKPNFPTKLLVFDLNSEYLQTLETTCLIKNFCYDKDNNRLIMNLEDEMQFAYLDLDGLIP